MTLDDEYDDYDDDEHECWEFEDMDLLAGRAYCRMCGTARWLTSDQLRRELELRGELDAQSEG